MVDKEKARLLRKEGWSIPAIAKEVKARNGLVHGWVSDIQVTTEARENFRLKSLSFKAEQENQKREAIREKTLLHIKEASGHRTKQKGDLAVAAVILSLVKREIIPCHPLTEHAPFDLVGVSADGKSYRIQVKFSSRDKDVISAQLTTSWSDKNGVHRVGYSENDFDILAIYCPEPETVCFVPKEVWAKKTAQITLRFTLPKNNNNCLLVTDFLTFPE